MDNVLLINLNGFEQQYKQQVTAYFNNSIIEVKGFNPLFPTADYATLVTNMNALGDGTTVPVSMANQLATIQTTTENALNTAIQTTINTVLTNLLAQVSKMCLSELITTVNSGLFANQITSAFIQANSEITPAVSAMVAAQLALVQSNTTVTPAAIALANTFFNTNATAMTTAYTTALTTLQTTLTTALTALTTTLTATTNAEIKTFQNLAISEINSIVLKVFGTTTVLPIPPVV